LAFLRDIRVKYPTSIIAVIEPLLQSCSEDSLLSDISDAILQAAVDMNDDRVIFYPTGTVDEPWLSCRDDYIDYTHPNIEGNIKFAAKLYQSMKDDVCSIFPNKCRTAATSGNVPTYCGSSSCIQQVWDTLAGQYTCGERIKWLQSQGYSQSKSCTTVQDEFPTICLCAPNSPPQSNSGKAINMRPSSTPSTTPTKSPLKLQNTDNNIFEATAVPSPTPPPAQAVVDRISCVAIPQEELNALGLWAITNELCRQCEPLNPITWWPCDLSPPLCRCNPVAEVISFPTPPPVVPIEPTAISCVAVNQEDLPSDSDLWATTNESCKQCEPPDPITWWPCNTELCLCT